MTKKRLLLILVAATACGGIALAILATTLRPRVNKANFDRIQAGMTVFEVNLLLGGIGKSSPGGHGVCPWNWERDRNRIYIHFDQDTGRAKEAFFTGADGKTFARNPL
jgi:hypothetical protein